MVALESRSYYSQQCGTGSCVAGKSSPCARIMLCSGAGQWSIGYESTDGCRVANSQIVFVAQLWETGEAQEITASCCRRPLCESSRAAYEALWRHADWIFVHVQVTRCDAQYFLPSPSLCTAISITACTHTSTILLHYAVLL